VPFTQPHGYQHATLVADQFIHRRRVAGERHRTNAHRLGDVMSPALGFGQAQVKAMRVLQQSQLLVAGKATLMHDVGGRGPAPAAAAGRILEQRQARPFRVAQP
jgi:hypothetical protein